MTGVAIGEGDTCNEVCTNGSLSRARVMTSSLPLVRQVSPAYFVVTAMAVAASWFLAYEDGIGLVSARPLPGATHPFQRALGPEPPGRT